MFARKPHPSMKCPIWTDQLPAPTEGVLVGRGTEQRLELGQQRLEHGGD
jgi:hypothetical protein